MHCKYLLKLTQENFHEILPIKINFFHTVLPETLKIFVEPKALTPGKTAKLYCNSSSSNPPVELSWFNDGIPMEGGVTTVQPGLWGGKSASSIIKLNITQDMNDVKITCQGKNRALDLSINEAINLQVLCEYFFERDLI